MRYFLVTVTSPGDLRTCTLPAEEFIRRFLQHVLPKGFVKVRYCGRPMQRRPIRHILSPWGRILLNAPTVNEPSQEPFCLKFQIGVQLQKSA